MPTPKEILRRYGIKPKKKLGQSFLVDVNAIRKIAQAARINPDDIVLEIGAGIGVLTKYIAQIARKVVAVEIDPQLVTVLQDQRGEFSNIEVCLCNILKLDFVSISNKYGSKLKVIGNVPYNISSPVVFNLLSNRSVISDFTLMLQKEVVERLVSLPGHKTYGIPSVLLQTYADMERLFDVSATCFYPAPKVDSSILRGAFRSAARVELSDEILFNRLVKASFAQRRKMLSNNLKNAEFLKMISDGDLKSALCEAGIDGKRRGETLSLFEFGSLSNILKNRLTNIL